MKVKAKICVCMCLQGLQERKAAEKARKTEWLTVYICVSLSAALEQNDSLRAKGLGLSSVNYSPPSSRGPLSLHVCVCAWTDHTQ